MNENASDIRKGQVIKLDDVYWVVIESTLNTPGNKRGIVQMKLKNVQQGNHISKRFSSTEMVEYVHTEKRGVEYLYKDAAGHVFMDDETYEQTTLSEDLIEDALPFMAPNNKVLLQYIEGSPVGIELPSAVVLEVTEAEAGVKGDTATSPTKKATLETGHVVKVPLHVNVGDKLKVDTRTGDFLSRDSRA